MQVAEKRMAVDKGMATVIVAKQGQDGRSERAKLNGTHELTEVRGVYDASGNGVHTCAPLLSAEASEATPFLSLSREQWQEVREQVANLLERFVSAVEEQHADKVLSIGMEMQEVAGRILLEAYAMSADLDLKDVPR